MAICCGESWGPILKRPGFKPLLGNCLSMEAETCMETSYIVLNALLQGKDDEKDDFYKGTSRTMPPIFNGVLGKTLQIY